MRISEKTFYRREWIKTFLFIVLISFHEGKFSNSIKINLGGLKISTKPSSKNLF